MLILDQKEKKENSNKQTNISHLKSLHPKLAMHISCIFSGVHILPEII